LPEAPREIKAEDCESLIRQIRDVISVNIVPGASGKIEEIHVLAEDARGAKQIVRDIETLFRLEYGIDLDHKKVSVVQLKKEQKLQQEKRLKFSSIQVSLQGNRMEASVELASPKKNCQGKLAGVNTRTGRLRLVAEAALQAAGSFLDSDSCLLLEEVSLVTLGHRQVVCLSVAYVKGPREESLAGCALVRQDDKEAVVRAVLSALNRRVNTDI